MPTSRSRSRSRTRHHHHSRHYSRTPTRSASPHSHHRHHHSSDRARSPRDHHQSHRHRDRSRSSSRARSLSDRRDRDHRRHRYHHRSSRRDRSSSRRRSHKSSTPQPSRTASPPPVLPYNAPQITKYDFPAYEALLAKYLDIQKSIPSLKAIGEREVRGRWKRFISHWNRGELAKGWYDPSVRVKALEAARTPAAEAPTPSSTALLFSRSVVKENEQERRDRRQTSEDVDINGGDGSETSSEDEIVGPTLPGMEPTGRKSGVKFPTIEDLELQKEQSTADALAAREDLRQNRKANRARQKAELDDLLPRADPGSRERRLEKKKELNEKMRGFREKSPGGDVDDATLMGGGGGSDSFKQLKAAKERKKNERELRKEALLRSRMEEREMRMRAHREKEEKTIAMLKALAESSQKKL